LAHAPNAREPPMIDDEVHRDDDLPIHALASAYEARLSWLERELPISSANCFE